MPLAGSPQASAGSGAAVIRVRKAREIDPLTAVLTRCRAQTSDGLPSDPGLSENYETFNRKLDDMLLYLSLLDSSRAHENAGLKREVKEFFATTGLAIMEGYGLTECSPTLTLNRPKDYRFDSVGKVLPSVELALAEDGEILARGPSVFRGYHKDEAATREAFSADGWFKTGDIGRFTDDGFLQIVDRKKDILVTAGGKNVAPANVEQLFASDPLIAHAVVYGEGKKYLVAGFWLNPPMPEDPAELQGLDGQARLDAARRFVQAKVTAANERVAHHETIKTFHLFDKPLTIEAGFLTPTMKIRRKAIVSAFRDTFEGLYT
jgi:long-chain acyl-CoA synthetase